MEDTNKLKDEVESAVSRAENLDALEAIRISELGKNGRITLLMKGLGQLGPAERRLVGKKLNELKNTILDLIEKKKPGKKKQELNSYYRLSYHLKQK